MMFRRSLLLSCLCACGAALALAQAPKKEKEAPPPPEPKQAENVYRGELPKDGISKLENDYSKEVRQAIRDMEDGKVEAGKDDEGKIDILAKWYTYRLTWPTIQDNPKEINGLMLDLDREFSTAAKNENTKPFQHLFARALARNARDVLPNRAAIARVNAARVLMTAAFTGEPEVANVLVEILNSTDQDPGTKYYACKGLQEFLAPGGKMPPTLLKDQALQNRITLALLGFLDQKLPVTPATPQDEVDGWRYLRREAVHALALTQNPAVVEQNKPVGRTAQVLLRVVRKDGFVPEPRYDEEIEAAIGIGWMQCKLYPGYQPDYAIHNAAYAVLDLASKYDSEKGSTTEKGWRYYSARLSEALDNLQRDVAKTYAKDKELVSYVNEVWKETSKVLHLMETRGEVKPADFEQWLQNHPPKSDTVYKGVADSKVKPGGETAEK
jgi:hypothetical protein